MMDLLSKEELLMISRMTTSKVSSFRLSDTDLTLSAPVPLRSTNLILLPQNASTEDTISHLIRQTSNALTPKAITQKLI